MALIVPAGWQVVDEQRGCVLIVSERASLIVGRPCTLSQSIQNMLRQTIARFAPHRTFEASVETSGGIHVVSCRGDERVTVGVVVHEATAAGYILAEPLCDDIHEIAAQLVATQLAQAGSPFENWLD